MLRDLVNWEWGKDGKVTIDPTAELFIETKVKLEQNTQKGIYRAVVGPADQFNPEQTTKAKALDTILRLLQGKKDKEKWDWLDLERITQELEICFYADYSSVTNEDILFGSDAKNAEELIDIETKNSSRSTFGYWYTKLSCIKDNGRVFLATVIYTDQMRIEDIERTVQYWRNNPKTVTKWVNGSRQRLLQTVVSKVVGDTTYKRGQSCYTKKSGWWFKKRRRRVCNTWSNTKTKRKTLQLIKQRILTDVTPKKFQYAVNHWVKDTKQVLQRRHLTLGQRENLKDWLHNTVLGEVIKHFGQFFTSPTDTLPIDELFTDGDV
jgi:hypothetical protein